MVSSSAGERQVEDDIIDFKREQLEDDMVDLKRELTHLKKSLSDEIKEVRLLLQGYARDNCSSYIGSMIDYILQDAKQMKLKLEVANAVTVHSDSRASPDPDMKKGRVKLASAADRNDVNPTLDAERDHLQPSHHAVHGRWGAAAGHADAATIINGHSDAHGSFDAERNHVQHGGASATEGLADAVSVPVLPGEVTFGLDAERYFVHPRDPGMLKNQSEPGSDAHADRSNIQRPDAGEREGHKSAGNPVSLPSNAQNAFDDVHDQLRQKQQSLRRLAAEASSSHPELAGPEAFGPEVPREQSHMESALGKLRAECRCRWQGSIYVVITFFEYWEGKIEKMLLFLLVLLCMWVQLAFTLVAKEWMSDSQYTDDLPSNLQAWRLALGNTMSHHQNQTLWRAICDPTLQMTQWTRQEGLVTQSKQWLTWIRPVGGIPLVDGASLTQLALGIWLLKVVAEIDLMGDWLQLLRVYVRGANRCGMAGILPCVLIIVLGIRFLLAVALGYVGVLYLVATPDFSDLILNAVALSTILDVDELFYVAFVPSELKKVLEQPLPRFHHLSPRDGIGIRDCRWSASAGLLSLKLIIVSGCLTLIRFYLMQPVIDNMKSTQSVICSE